jgi:hypothetical protein
MIDMAENSLQMFGCGGDEDRICRFGVGRDPVRETDGFAVLIRQNAELNPLAQGQAAENPVFSHPSDS